MSRLADYFVVVGYNREKERSGKVVQRFPEKDWSDTPFIEGIEWFCQPLGWSLSTERQEPKFFVSVLTDIDCNRHYCACFSFHETISIVPSKPVDEEEDNVETDNGHHSLGGSLSTSITSITHHSIMYAPKCFVIVSRLDYIETFRNCLGIVYTVFIENLGVPLETLIGNILGCVQVPPPGGPQVRFSIGAGDRQALQPPLSSTIPVTGTSVSLLFQQFGISNVLRLFSAIMTEQKILFLSKSYSRLFEGCRALIALMYPFRQTHVYIPILPAALTEVLSTPTPFLMGVHSSLKCEVNEMVVDVIIADIDGGAVTIPEGVHIPILPEPILTQTQESLMLVLQPELNSADLAFLPPSQKPSAPPMLDKELRAIFMRVFAHLLQGYRSCLTIIRIHPKPVITFHKTSFLSERGLFDCEFTKRLLDCMFFTGFVQERGPSWRVCDLWDELYSNLTEHLRQESDPKLVLTHIQELAQQLYTNENPNQQPYVAKLIRPPDGAFTRIHQPELPHIKTELVQNIIDEELTKSSLKSSPDDSDGWISSMRPSLPRIVPMGPIVTHIHDPRNLVTNSARRLEVLRNCINCIFDNKISDARKTFPAVLKALKFKPARLALCTELAQHVIGNKAMLEHQQFDLVVRLMNCALQDDTLMDGYGVAAALLPLATAFCRKLCTGVIQFAYTCIQDHSVWQNQQFWEASFYQDVQKDIKALYRQRQDLLGNSTSSRLSLDASLSPISPRDGKDYTWKDRRSMHIRALEPTSLEIAAEQMRLWPNYDTDKQNELSNSEESTIYSQAIHYANRMVYLLVPLDVTCKNHQKNAGHGSVADDERASNSIANSVIESDSMDAESGFEEQDPGEVGNQVIKTVSRFVDKVCTEGGVNSEHVRCLHMMIPGVVHMHIETLDAVYRESKRLPPIQKPKILTPTLLSGEELVVDGTRVYLLPDGRDDHSGVIVGGPTLLPAEGAIFLTNYRIIFRGTPCDPFASEQVVVRAFPITSLTKEKRISVQCPAQLEQFLQDGLQLRSCTFQLIRVAFDEEVTTEQLETFRKMIHRLRNPPHIFHHFAFNGQVIIPQTPLSKDKEKNATLKGFAKKTLLRTARKAGFKPKPSSKRQKYVLPNSIGNNNKYMTSPSRLSLPLTEITDYEQEDNVSMLDELDTVGTSVAPAPTDAKTLERLSERSYVRDWCRLGLCPDSPTNSAASGSSPRPRSEQFRLSTVNHCYMTCRTYPAMLVVPATITDESIRRLGRCHRHNRIPVATWKHPKTKALLLRGAGFHAKGVMGMLKGHPSSAGKHGVSSESATSTAEQEKYLYAVVQATPISSMKPGPANWDMSESNLSIDSLYISNTEHDQHGTTPEQGRKINPFAKAIAGTLGRTSGGKGPKAFGRLGSVKDRRHSSQNSLANLSVPLRSNQRYSADSDSGTECVQSLQRASLYIFGEKTHIKGLKTEVLQKIDFIPIEYYEVKHTKTAFKKLMRACLPSTISNEPEQSFAKLIEGSEWLNQLQNIMQHAGAVVDLLDSQGSSVMLCLEDGFDVTTQISSVAQICLDPHYRTLEGFRLLVEKEWLAFGHRFSHRSTLAESSQASGFAPIFLQFLDIVHQIHQQFPLAFEFNDFYLRFLAYHYVSCRFRTFLLDSEFERVECGIAAVEDKRGSLSSHYKGVDTGSDDDSIYPGGRIAGTSTSPNLGQSVFDYIDKQHARSPIFYNFFYTPDYENTVLRPQSQLCNIDIWNYYLDEELFHGPSYDLEVVQQDAATDEGDKASMGTDSNSDKGPPRRVVMAGYDGISQAIPDAFTYTLEEIHKLEIDLGHLPQKWKILFDKLELPPSESISKTDSFSTQLVRYHGKLSQKRATLEILMRGKIVSASETAAGVAGNSQQPHRFERYNFTTPSYCDYCSNILWGPVKTGLRCQDCAYSCHEKCIEHVPKSCSKYKSGHHHHHAPVQDGTLNTSTLTRANADTGSVSSSVTTIPTSCQQYYDIFSSNVAENRTYEGYLYKRGALLKGWKQRWFVLDSIKHQLRYYDAMEDSNCKGLIDLAEVVSVTPAAPAPGPPKKTDDKSFFDVRTQRRTYNFCASNASSALEWIEKIQSCLQ